ncbi:short chain dehydrogenase family protein [Blastomonas sp. RAC04]|uniref:SDR family oxidoreductase n=1 Tax=Blastomonas sp. RAC04 TaxID=1842535 RepID=UPI00083CA780|nr:SDR family oxidoreductase [Blastomonas sp. RAC04]AOF99162.1 short chain dehydrogenase family protein [Blastomonas sp. RAC04]
MTSSKSKATKAGATDGRLAGKVALVTGAAGNLGGAIIRRFIGEGATLVMTGRTAERLEAAKAALLAETGVDEARVFTVILDGGDPDSVRAAMGEVKAALGRIDVLVNNAGSAGPRQTLENVPLTKAEMEANGDTETVADAMRNLLGVSWNLTRAAAPIMPAGGSVINISTIFAHTRYHGRTAYVVPKAALNALSQELAKELGAEGIRVNTVFPGPIESERIRTVFASMDKLQGEGDGATADYFMGRMSLKRAMGGAKPAKTLPVPGDIADACLFLASDESSALNGNEIDVTHGMEVRKDSRSTYMTRPSMRSLDGTGLSVLIAAGEQWEDALEIARIQLLQGARVLLGLTRQVDVAQAEARVRAQNLGDGIDIMRFNRAEPDGMEAVLRAFSDAHGPINSAIILPVKASNLFSATLAGATDADVDLLLDIELSGAIALARTLARYWKQRTDLLQDPRYVFMSSPTDGNGDRFGRIMTAAIAQLITIWRDESRVEALHGRQQRAVWGNQIIRYTNAEEDNIRFAAGHATRIVFKEQKITETSLYLPANIGEETGARKAMLGFAENITGLHLGKVALITGGSAGIGGQVARLLALAGAKVMMVARRESELEAARERIVGELQDVGFSGVERRIKFIANVDVSDFDSLRRAADATMEEFGRIDYLINNAGVAGAEDMVIDMPLDTWRWTLDANLISNYLLMHYVVPIMKRQGSGYILNVSSYFGGEKFLAVAYPNRADYAVSKAGQRAMVESFSRFLGPEIQVNAIAPGPVDGDRLSGTGGKPGLFLRRARLILENKRLNAIYAAVIESIREGAEVTHVLGRLARNDTGYLSHDRSTPDPLRLLCLELAREGDGICTWDRYLLTPDIAGRLLARLRSAGYLLQNADWQARSGTADGLTGWLMVTPPDDMPYLPQDRIGKEADKVGRGVLSQLHLGAMPKESEVAQATVFYLADRAVSGETFMPSGGLSVERSYTEREMFGSPKQERLDRMKGTTVWVIGEHLADYIAETANHLIGGLGVARMVLLTRTKAGGAGVLAMLDAEVADKVTVRVCGADIEGAMDTALTDFGRPTTVVSTPMAGLPDRLFEDGAMLDPAEFRDLCEENLTHHFRIARKASLYDGCQLVLVSPDVPFGQSGPAFALANFVKTTLHAFTATLAVENERLVHDVPTNQINLTRRIRSEEPRNAVEHQEELKRFARAVLLVGAPLPDAQDSRYRARIYRGTSMTV